MNDGSRKDETSSPGSPGRDNPSRPPADPHPSQSFGGQARRDPALHVAGWLRKWRPHLFSSATRAGRVLSGRKLVAGGADPGAGLSAASYNAAGLSRPATMQAGLSAPATMKPAQRGSYNASRPQRGRLQPQALVLKLEGKAHRL